MEKIKRIATIKSDYIRDTRVFNADPAIIRSDPDWDKNFVCVKNPRLFAGVYEGLDENEIRCKAAAKHSVHPDAIALVEIDQESGYTESERIIVGRPINGISINGLEFIMGNDGEPMVFPSVDAAKSFLRDNDVSDEAMEGMRFLDADTHTDADTIAAFDDEEVSYTERFEYERLHAHNGHNIEVVTYANGANVSVECVDCNVVLISADNPLYERMEENES